LATPEQTAAVSMSGRTLAWSSTPTLVWALKGNTAESLREKNRIHHSDRIDHSGSSGGAESIAQPSGGMSSRLTRPWWFRCVWLVTVIAAWSAPLSGLAAPPLRENFDGANASWRLATADANVRLQEQSRVPDAGVHSGAERLHVQLLRLETPPEFDIELLPSRVFDELTATVQLRANRPGWKLGLRVVLPNAQPLPSGELVSFLVFGPASQLTERWETLQAQTTDREISQKLILMRGRYGSQLDAAGMYADRVVLAGPSAIGEHVALTDELEVGPLVEANDVAATPRSAEPSSVRSLERRLDRLFLDGRPFLPRMIPYHGESPAVLKALGVNVVWIPDFADLDLAEKLQAEGLSVVAAPPQLLDEQGEIPGLSTVAMAPLPSAADHILFWMMGTRLSRQQRPEIRRWLEQIQSADRRRGRLLAADVADEERQYSREISLLGISRHPLQTTTSLKDYRQWLTERRNLARPGTVCWTWIQTEPAPAWARLAPDDLPWQVEPEQLRLQLYAAIAAGCRGFGFWTTQNLEGNSPLLHERRLALSILNDELQLLEPWLSTANGSTLVPLTVTPLQDGSANVLSQTSFLVAGSNSGGANGSARVFNERGASGGRQPTRLTASTPDGDRRDAAESDGLDAAMLRTDYGTLLLPMWLDSTAQFVPGQSANAPRGAVELVIPGGEQASSVWEVSTTEVRSLPREFVAGGMKVRLTRFDQTTMIWMTSQVTLVDQLRQRVAQSRAEQARKWVELAQLKFDRVAQTHQQLVSLAPTIADAPQLLGMAKLRLERAAAEMQVGNAHAAKLRACESMQLLRILQRACWESAISHHAASTFSSPYLTSFQSLPAHWQLLEKWGAARQPSDTRSLPAGDFEDRDAWIGEGWTHRQNLSEALRGSAELYPEGHHGRYSLRLTCEAAPGFAAPTLLPEVPITISSPELPVYAGDCLYVSGWAKLAAPITASRESVLVYDSLAGRTGALRLNPRPDWQQFELLRPVKESGPWQLHISLTGLGDVLIDDLKVSSVPLERSPRSVPPATTSGSAATGSPNNREERSVER
jgi:hypothetical protein